MPKTHDDLLRWLHRLDSYGNSEFGRARTLWALQDGCVACGRASSGLDATGLCRTCQVQRAPDYDEVVLFRPMRRPPDGQATPDGPQADGDVPG